MSQTKKDKKRKAKGNLAECRQIITFMEGFLNGKDETKFELACAFFHVFNYHLALGDLKPENVHMAALLRYKDVTL